MKINTFKRIALLIIIILSTLCLTSCKGTSSTVMDFTNNTLPEDIRKRFDANIDIIHSLQVSGFISEGTANNYIDGINKLKSNFLSDTITISAEGINGDTGVLDAISQLVVYDWESLGTDHYEDTLYAEVNGEEGEYTVTYGANSDEGHTVNWVKGDRYIGNFLISNSFAYGPSTFNYKVSDSKSVAIDVTDTYDMIVKHIHPRIARLGNSTQYFGTQNNDKGDSVVTGVGHCIYKWGSMETFYANKKEQAENKKNNLAENELMKITSDQAAFNHKITPLSLVSYALANEISNKMNFEVYVLKPEIFTQDGNSTLDSVVATTKEAFKKNSSGELNKDSTTINGMLADYFQPLQENGNNVTLLDLAGDDYRDFSIIQYSDDVDINNYDHNQMPGKDLVITQRKIGVPVMAIKFFEFNHDAYKKLDSMLGINDGKFMFVANKDGKGLSGRVYILEYPVYALDTLNDSGNKVTGTFKHSGLGINFYTGKVLKYELDSYADGEYAFKSNGKVIDDTTVNYLTVLGADSNSQDGKSSFIVKGKTNMEYDIDIGTTTKHINTEVGRIILRDYLEGTYAPGFHTSEDVVAFGRKIRLMFHEWSGENSEQAVWNKTTAAAKFIDKDGNDVEDSAMLYITDFCDADSLLDGDTARVEILPGLNEVYESIQSTSVQTSDYKSIDNLDVHKVSSISPTLLFPSTEIDKEDFVSDNTAKQRFWVLTTRKGIFNSGLYTGWINSTSESASLTWWNAYLSANSMKYKVDQIELNSYITGNYKYEVGRHGEVLIVDLDTIKFIQDQMTEDTEIERNQLIRTSFIILGWFLICYSVLLILAWAVDTNADIGIDLLNKLTMGNWIAVKYSEDIPAHDISGVKCIDPSRLMFGTIILIVVGILLININIFDLIIVLIEYVGSLSRALEKLLQGTR